MTIKSETILRNQIEEEQRWDVVFNIELKSLFNQNIDLISVEDISSHITNGATPLGAQFPNKGVPFYRANDVKKFSFNFLDHKFITSEQSKVLKRSILKPKDIVFTIKGKVGDIAVFPEGKEESNINQDNALIRLKEGHDPYYFAGIFNSKFGFNQIKAYATATINPFLGLGNLKKLKLPLLKEKERKEISKEIKLADDKNIEALKILNDAKIELYNLIGIDFSKISNEKFFSVKLSDFESASLWTPKYSFPFYVDTTNKIKDKFSIKTLGEIVNIKRGDEVGSENYNRYLEKADNDIPFIRTSDLLNYELDSYPDYHIPLEIYGDLKQDLKENDILFTKDGRVGMLAMLTKRDKAIIASGVCRLRLKDKIKNITPEYLFLVLSLDEIGLNSAIRRTVVASTIPHLREERLKEIEIPILKDEEILKITEKVKKAFQLKNEKKVILENVRKRINSHFEV